MRFSWLDSVIDEIESKGLNMYGPFTISSGISLSGPPHFGHGREFFTAYAITGALQARGYRAKMFAFADDLDPLRKVYNFLPPEYSRYIGIPLCDIPDPKDEYANYAERNLQPLMKALDNLGITVEIVRVSELYRSRKFDPSLNFALENSEKMMRIVASLSGSKIDPNKDCVFAPQCPQCLSVTKTSFEGWEEDRRSMKINCECGYSDSIEIFGNGGKLKFRYHWPTMWRHWHTTVEPVAQDHAVGGGTFHTASAIAREVMNIIPPHPIVYQWVHSEKAMHTTSGNAVSLVQASEQYPRQLVWYTFLRHRPEQVIKFDQDKFLEEESTLLGNEDDQALWEVQLFSREATDWKKLTMPEVITAIKLAKLSGDSPEATLSKMGNTSFPDKRTIATLENWVEANQQWYQPSTPVPTTEEELNFIQQLSGKLDQTEWDRDSLQDLVRNTMKECNIPAKKGYALLYALLLGTDNGPRMGVLFDCLGKEYLLSHLN